jgi:short-subunit dehydrogenase
MGISKKKIRIIIFGASGSIGSYLVKEYMSQNSELLLFVKNLKSKKKIMNKLKFQSSSKIIVDQLNFTNFSSITKKINKHKSFVKNSDVIINATGSLGEIKNVLNINFKKFKNTMDINFFSNLILLQNLSKFIKNNKNLLIIFFSGGGVTSYRKNFGTYSISKLSLVKLIEIISNEINNKNVRINAIAPGIIQSKMVDIAINNRKLVSKKEIKKIERDIKYSNDSLKKLFKVINFLRSNKGKQITGKLISSKWDNIETWNKNKIKRLINKDLYNVRRIQ